MSKRKATKSKLPPVRQQDTKQATKLPVNVSALADGKVIFSFAQFDRTHELFNLGNKSSNTVKAEWYIDLLDCLKEVNNRTVAELHPKPFELHQVKWEDANPKPPKNAEQFDYWQFRISKTKGRVIGFMIPHNGTNIFFIVWLDPHHNLTNSEHYEKATSYTAAKSLSELEADTK